MQNDSVLRKRTKCIPNHESPANHPPLESLGVAGKTFFARLFKSGASSALNKTQNLPHPPSKPNKKCCKAQTCRVENCQFPTQSKLSNQLLISVKNSKFSVLTIFCTETHFISAQVVWLLFKAL